MPVSTKAFLLAGFLAVTNVPGFNAERLRRRGNETIIANDSVTIAANDSVTIDVNRFVTAMEALEPKMEVINKTEIKLVKNGSCLCPLGKFWHWRVHKCIPQGGWGYECGFFPAEHHHRVCNDELKCQKTRGAPDLYVSHGMYHGTANTFPASCVPCLPKDQCVVGEKRHSEECLTSISLEGESSQTVRVTVPGIEASASATESHTSNVEGTDDTKTASATKEATTSVDGVAEYTASVSIEEAKKALGLEDVDEVGEVLAARIIDQANKMAFERASAGALKKAQEMGLLKAQNAAESMAESQAAEEAKLQADRLAHEAAAWAKEAGENAAAQAAAEARAKALAAEEAEAKRQEAQARRRADERAKAAAEEAMAQRQAEKDAEEAAAQAQGMISDLASGGMSKKQDNGVDRADDAAEAPGEKKNRLRKVSQKDVDAKSP